MSKTFCYILFKSISINYFKKFFKLTFLDATAPTTQAQMDQYFKDTNAALAKDFTQLQAVKSKLTDPKQIALINQLVKDLHQFQTDLLATQKKCKAQKLKPGACYALCQKLEAVAIQKIQAFSAKWKALSSG